MVTIIQSGNYFVNDKIHLLNSNILRISEIMSYGTICLATIYMICQWMAYFFLPLFLVIPLLILMIIFTIVFIIFIIKTSCTLFDYIKFRVFISIILLMSTTFLLLGNYASIYAEKYAINMAEQFIEQLDINVEIQQQELQILSQYNDIYSGPLCQDRKWLKISKK